MAQSLGREMHVALAIEYITASANQWSNEVSWARRIPEIWCRQADTRLAVRRCQVEQRMVGGGLEQVLRSTQLCSRRGCVVGKHYNYTMRLIAPKVGT